MSPTQRALAELRKWGAVAAITEKRVPRMPHITQDLFGFVDVLALLGPNCIAIQVTSGANHAARRAKIIAEPKARAWLNTGNLIEVWSWSKTGARGKRKLWTLRREEIVLADLEGGP